jgi:hypothetical protein
VIDLRAVALAVVAAIAASACSSMPQRTMVAPSPPAKIALDEFRATFGGEWAADYTDDGFVASLTGVPAQRSFIEDGGRKLRPFLPRLAGAPAAVSFDDDARVVHLGSLTQYHYPQRVRGREVEDADYIVQVDDHGGPYEIFLNAVRDASVPDTARLPDEAVSLVRLLVNKELERGRNIRAAQGDRRISITLLDNEPHYLGIERKLHSVYEVEARVSVVMEDAHEAIVMLRIYSVDAGSRTNDESAIVRLRNLIHFSAEGTARVFKPNPVTLLDTSGTISSFCPAPAFPFTDPPYSPEKLTDLDDAKDGKYTLTGTSVCIRYGRKGTDGPAKRDDTDFSCKRGTVDFAAASAYYHVTELARRARDLGFSDLVRERLEVEAFDYVSDGIEACFIEGNGGNIQPHMAFCRTRVCGIFAAEDGDVVAHEYAHALLQKKTGTRFLLEMQKKNKNEAGAINEGFADYWSLSYGAEASSKHKYDVASFAEWANGGSHLRDYPFRKHSTFKDTEGIHGNGQIWSGTLYEILRTIFSMSTDNADKLILRGHLQRASKATAPTMKQMAEGIVVADGGANHDALCAIFKTHELWPLVCCKEKACVANRLTLPN